MCKFLGESQGRPMCILDGTMCNCKGGCSAKEEKGVSSQAEKKE